MRREITIILALTTFSLGVVPTIADDKPAAAESWTKLPLIKDGKVDPSWVHIGWGQFVVDGDALRTECDEKGMGLLLYKAKPFGNCQIRVTYKSKEPKSNAGVFVRIDPGVLEKGMDKPTPVKRNADGKLESGALDELKKASELEQGPWYAVHHGFEVQICDSADPGHRTGSIYSLADAGPVPQQKGEWRTMMVTLKGTSVSVELDGKPVTTFDSDSKNLPERKNWYEPKREAKRPQVGYIGLQNHDPGDVVYFKEISVRPIP